MTEIKLTKRYPHSRTEDITDAFMRGYEQGKKDGLKVGKQIVLGAFETYITADRKTEPTCSKMEQVDKDINVRSKTEPQTCDTCKWGEWYRKGYDITMMSDECGGCCSWNNKWKPKTDTEREDTEIMGLINE